MLSMCSIFHLHRRVVKIGDGWLLNFAIALQRQMINIIWSQKIRLRLFLAISIQFKPSIMKMQMTKKMRHRVLRYWEYAHTNVMYLDDVSRYACRSTYNCDPDNLICYLAWQWMYTWESFDTTSILEKLFGDISGSKYLIRYISNRNIKNNVFIWRLPDVHCGIIHINFIWDMLPKMI